MSAGFSAHDPTAHLKEPEAAHGGCGCHGDPGKMVVPDPRSIDELIIFREVAVDAETSTVRLAGPTSGGKEQKALEETLEIINRFSQYLAQAPFPHCPAAPKPGPQSAREQIDGWKQAADAACAANDFPKAIALYTSAAELACSPPPFQPSRPQRDQLCSLLCGRSAAYSAASSFLEALADAQAVVILRRNLSMGHLHRAKALLGLGRVDDAKDAALCGLEFEPDHAKLQAYLIELSG